MWLKNIYDWFKGTDIFRLFKEWLKTLSSKESFFSSKRLEKFTFTAVVVAGYISTMVYLIVSDKLTATEFAIASSPLLLAGGYNLSKIENSKKLKDGES